VPARGARIAPALVARCVESTAHRFRCDFRDPHDMCRRARRGCRGQGRRGDRRRDAAGAGHRRQGGVHALRPARPERERGPRRPGGRRGRARHGRRGDRQPARGPPPQTRVVDFARMVTSEAAKRWGDEIARLTQPDDIHWCDGSEEERNRLTVLAMKQGDLLGLNADKLPGCYYHRSSPTDVARTEHLTFICSADNDDAGPTNNWMSPDEAKGKLTPLFTGAMRGRVMYVVPFVMGPLGSAFSRVGVQITDSIYVVLNMRIMTRMGNQAWDQLGGPVGDQFTRCLHSIGDLSPDRRYICHFPATNEVWSVGSGYGGNALLGKKCLALRIASALGRKQGWLAEHMLIVGIQSPDGQTRYVTGAFPSACGKTNLAMLVPPARFKGW